MVLTQHVWFSAVLRKKEKKIPVYALYSTSPLIAEVHIIIIWLLVFFCCYCLLFFFSLSCLTGWCYTVFPRDKKEEDYKETAHSCFSEKTVPSEESLQPTKGIPFSPTFPKILYHQLTYFYQ